MTVVVMDPRVREDDGSLRHSALPVIPAKAGIHPRRPQPKNARNSAAVASGCSSGMKCPAGMARPETAPLH